MTPKARGGKQGWSLSPSLLVSEVGVKATLGASPSVRGEFSVWRVLGQVMFALLMYADSSDVMSP